MGETVQYKITPSEIDASSNIDTLDDYTLSCTQNAKLEQRYTIATGVTLTATYLGHCYLYELISDYAVTLTIGTQVYTGVRNVILNLGTRLTVAAAPTIENASGSTATVIWKMYDLTS